MQQSEQSAAVPGTPQGYILSQGRTVAHRGGGFSTAPKGLQAGWAASALRKSPANQLTCPVCSKLFLRRGRLKTTFKKVCCSRKCAAVLRPLDIIPGFNLKTKSGPVQNCKTCGKQFQHAPSRRAKYCSMVCRFKDSTSLDCIRGARHYNWKGGITPKNQTLRSSPEARAWTLAIFRRDKFTCQLCKTVRRNLQAHHKFPWALFPSLRFEVSNGITLCKGCHNALHTFGRRTAKRINKELQDYDYDCEGY